MKNYFLIPLLALVALACKNQPSKEVVPVSENRLVRIEVSEPISEIQTTHWITYNSSGEIDSINTVATYQGNEAKRYSAFTYTNNLVSLIKRGGEFFLPTLNNSRTTSNPRYNDEVTFIYSGKKLSNWSYLGINETVRRNWPIHYAEDGKLDFVLENQEQDTLRAYRDSNGKILYFQNTNSKKLQDGECEKILFSLTDQNKAFKFIIGGEGCSNYSEVNGKYSNLLNPFPDILWDHLTEFTTYPNITKDISNFLFDEIEPKNLVLEYQDMTVYTALHMLPGPLSYEYTANEKGNLLKMIERQDEVIKSEFNFIYE